LHRIVRADNGKILWLTSRGAFVYESTNGRAVRFSGIFTDDTSRQESQQRLRELNNELEKRVAERTRALRLAMHEQQRMHQTRFQAKKMEAVGQLTAGVAHDFNNLLLVVLGSLEVAADRTSDKDILRLIESAARAAKKGASLTAQLLAFGRQQDLNIEATNLH